MILDWTKTRMALFLVGSNTTYPSYFMIGSGSGIVVSTQTTLFNPIDRQEMTLANGSIAFKVKWIGDWNSSEMSGIQLREWGITISGGTTTGSMWSKNVMSNTITFDGTAELRIEENWEVF